MKSTERTPNYDFAPAVFVQQEVRIYDRKEIAKVINSFYSANLNIKPTIVFDLHPGVNVKQIKKIIGELGIKKQMDLSQFRLSDSEMEMKFITYLTNHPNNGKFSVGEVGEFYKDGTKEIIADKLNEDNSLVISGVGAAALVETASLLILVNSTFDAATEYLQDTNEYLSEKRLKYLDFHLYDLHKRYLWERIDFVIDASTADLRMMNKEHYLKCITEITSKPFRTVPLFQENIWGGGLWFQEVLGSAKTDKKYSFLVSAILEEQYVTISNKESSFNIPGKDIIALEPLRLLGERIFFTYGYRSPIHLLLVDTIGGANSSLQVHPTASYNQDYMNYPYGHHEGYYIVKTTADSSVYLGIDEKYNVDDFIEALKKAKNTGEFAAEEYVGHHALKQYDYIYLPGGVVHAFGKETVCLEIDSFSTTTFKLWDWGRLGSDGKPRQIDLDLGSMVIQPKFSSKWSQANLFSREFSPE